jgi:hypothetical protein
VGCRRDVVDTVLAIFGDSAFKRYSTKTKKYDTKFRCELACGGGASATHSSTSDLCNGVTSAAVIRHALLAYHVDTVVFTTLHNTLLHVPDCPHGNSKAIVVCSDHSISRYHHQHSSC